jgi:hypothetical protein
MVCAGALLELGVLLAPLAVLVELALLQAASTMASAVPATAASNRHPGLSLIVYLFSFTG